MRLTTDYIIGGIIGIVILVLDIIFLRNTKWFFPVALLGVVIVSIQYLISYFNGLRKTSRLEDLFPGFVRDLVSALKSGIPMNKAVIFVAENDYGELAPYVKKLANQVEWGIPVKDAFKNFAYDTKSAIIIRSVETMVEAESFGGNMENALSSVTESLMLIKDMKKKREASIYSQNVQNYIIFMVFVGVIIVIQSFIVPFVAQSEATTGLASEIVRTGLNQMAADVPIVFTSVPAFINSIMQWSVSINGIFIMIIIIQGFFAGLVAGKLSSGTLKAGLKHSFIMSVLGIFIISIAQAFF